MGNSYLFIRLSALGDLVVTLPALEALREREPSARIHWLVEDRFADLLREVEGIDRLIVFPRRRLRGLGAPAALLTHFVQLRRDDYDVAIDFQGNLKGALQLARARASLRIGLERGAAREGAHLLAGVHVAPPPAAHRVVRALSLLRPLGVDAALECSGGTVPARLTPRFRRRAEIDARVEAALAAAGLAPPLVLLHPGSSAFGAFKRWPPERFGALARALHDSGERCAVTFGPGEAELARGVATAAGFDLPLLPPENGIAGLVALLRRAAVLVAADSGPLLLASALGVRTVGLFGPKDPAVYAPPFAGARVVRNLVPCSPCSLRRCPDPICMTELDVAPVLAAVREACGEERAAAG